MSITTTTTPTEVAGATSTTKSITYSGLTDNPGDFNATYTLNVNGVDASYIERATQYNVPTLRYQTYSVKIWNAWHTEPTTYDGLISMPPEDPKIKSTI